jgi:hypothetical protein
MNLFGGEMDEIEILRDDEIIFIATASHNFQSISSTFVSTQTTTFQETATKSMIFQPAKSKFPKGPQIVGRFGDFEFPIFFSIPKTNI